MTCRHGPVLEEMHQEILDYRAELRELKDKLAIAREALESVASATCTAQCVNRTSLHCTTCIAREALEKIT